jgi:predicted Fe-S protein YdhL (DUF1289 family)
VVYTDKVSHYCAGCGCHRLGYKAWVSIPLSEKIKICLINSLIVAIYGRSKQFSVP